MIFTNDDNYYDVTNSLIISILSIKSIILGGLFSNLYGNADIESGMGDKAGSLPVAMLWSNLADPTWDLTIIDPKFESYMECLAVDYLVSKYLFGTIVDVLQSILGSD